MNDMHVHFHSDVVSLREMYTVFWMILIRWEGARARELQGFSGSSKNLETIAISSTCIRSARTSMVFQVMSGLYGLSDPYSCGAAILEQPFSASLGGYPNKKIQQSLVLTLILMDIC